MRRFLCCMIFIICFIAGISQILPSHRMMQWEHAGLRYDKLQYDSIIDFDAHGGIPDGVTSNTFAMNALLAGLDDRPTVIQLGRGKYNFTAPIQLPNHIILRGMGASATELYFSGTIPGHLIRVQGNLITYYYRLTEAAHKGNDYILCNHEGNIAVGDYLKLSMNDSSIVTSPWAYGSVGQIVQVKSVHMDTIFLHSDIRLDYPLSLRPKVQKIQAAKQVGIECLKITRSSHSILQSANILFDYAVESWVDGIESDSCVFSHITISNASNIQVENSYFHHAFDYGAGGKAYGVMLQMTSNECLISNNIFQHLRHAMILQAGANANVFGYNYSIEPYWTEVDPLPANSAGDMVLYGNYAYGNLFEGNIAQHIVVDNSHGKNGPYNTFFRNRAELYGIFMNHSPASDSQHFIGNEVPHMGFLFGNFHLEGIGHFSYGNHVKGAVIPEGTDVLTDSTYYLSSKPSNYGDRPFPNIGLPNAMNSGHIPALDQYSMGQYTTCSTVDTSTHIFSPSSSLGIILYPNPVRDVLYIQQVDYALTDVKLSIYNAFGVEVLDEKLPYLLSTRIQVEGLQAGLYILHIKAKEGSYVGKFTKY